MSKFNQVYKNFGCVWGKDPNKWLKMFVQSVKQKGKVLEIGIGEGRDAIWMAEQGFEVEGIDNAKAGIEKAKKIAQEKKISNISLSCINAQEFNYVQEKYQIVYSFWTFNFMPRQDFIAILPKIKASIQLKGYFLTGVFTVMDNEKYTEEEKRIGHSYTRKEYSGHQFGLNQLLKDFIDFRILQYEEEVHDDPGHPPNFRPHKHACAMIFTQKIE